MAAGKQEVTKLRTVGVFLKGRACSDTLFHVLAEAYGLPTGIEERATMPLAGGILQHGYQCGMLWGAALAAGAEAHRRFGPGPGAEAASIVAAGRVVESFRSLNDGHRDCFEITELNEKSSKMQMVTYFLLKGGSVGCFRRAGRYAPSARRVIDAALDDAPADTPPPPVSCTGVLAGKLGVEERHRTMVSGLAGGIGLSGGGCGALGAAIWLGAMRVLREDGGKLAYKDPRALALIERFIRASDYRFECSKIVGRDFRDVADHAAWVREGGCAEILDVLAAEG